jgi:nitrite reductase/ring-hydroxylating ferredoxin subunit
MTEPSSKRVAVARADDVPARGGLAVEVGGIEIGVFRVEGGFLAIENACPHAGVPLSTGDVADCIVTCPAHGFQYDLRTGYAADHPDGFPIPRFEVVLEDGDLVIEADVDDDGALSPRPLRRTPPPRDA